MYVAVALCVVILAALSCYSVAPQIPILVNKQK